MNEKIFRQKSLDKIKSPESLDDCIQVSNPGVWLLPCNDDDAVRRKKNRIQGGFGLLSLGYGERYPRQQKKFDTLDLAQFLKLIVIIRSEDLNNDPPGLLF